MVRLSTTSSALQDKPHTLVQALQAGLHEPGAEDQQALSLVRGMLSAMPGEMQTDAAEAMQQQLTQGLPASAMHLLTDHAQNTAQRLSHMRKQLQKQEQAAQTPAKIGYHHCDYLGTPMTLHNSEPFVRRPNSGSQIRHMAFAGLGLSFQAIPEQCTKSAR